MKSLVTCLAFLFLAQGSFAYSTPAMTVKLVDKNNQPIAGFPVLLQTKATDLSKILIPHSSGKSINNQVTTLTGADGVAHIDSVFSMRKIQNILVEPAYVENCPDLEDYQTHTRISFMRIDNVGFVIASGTEKLGWSCSTGSDGEYSDLQENLVCRSTLTKEEQLAYLKQRVQETRAKGCEVEKNF